MKKLLILLIAVLTTVLVHAQTTEIRGVVTYYFNEYQGDKPDIGAKVFVIDSTNNFGFDYDATQQYIKGRLYSSFYSSYVRFYNQNLELLEMWGKKKRNREKVIETKEENKGHQKYIDEYYSDMVKYNVETKDKFDTLSLKVFLSYIKVIENDNIISRTIGGNGDYYIPVQSGTYYVFIRSKNRTGFGIAESSGKIYCKKIKIIDGQVKDVSTNFTKRNLLLYPQQKNPL